MASSTVALLAAAGTQPLAFEDVEKLSVEQQWHCVQKLDAEYRAQLSGSDARIEAIDTLLQNLRLVCLTTISCHFEFALSAKVEERLWEAHSILNRRYRQVLNSLLKARDPSNARVERRKWQKRYVDFIKRSQHFYKTYIYELAMRYASTTDCPHPLRRLFVVAGRMELATPPGDNVTISDELSRQVLMSGCKALLRLGDLARYREFIRADGQQKWDKSTTFYQLAIELYPHSGTPYNQLGVISKAEGDHLNTVYYLYRALAAEEPYPMSKDNLALEFKKIRENWEKEKQGIQVYKAPGVPAERPDNTPLSACLTWFVRLHSELSKGEDFTQHDAMENEFLSQLAALFATDALEGVLDKIVLSNIAAEYLMAKVLTGVSDGQPGVSDIESMILFMRLNIRTFQVLLNVLDVSINDCPDAPTENGVVAMVRRLVPTLRHYSTWFISNVTLVQTQISNPELSVYIRKLWKSYADTLTSLVNVFSVHSLPELTYLLEEDEAIIGFMPFREGGQTPKLFMNDDGPKPRAEDAGIEREPADVEILARVRDILMDGLRLANDPATPLMMYDGAFYYVGDAVQLACSGVVNGVVNAHGVVVNGAADGYTGTPSPGSGDQSSHTTVSPGGYNHDPLDASDSVLDQSVGAEEFEMNRMVDELVSNNNTPKRGSTNGTQGQINGSVAPPAGFGDEDFNSMPMVRQLSNTRPLPSLPGMSGSPFTPCHNELPSQSPERASSGRRLSPAFLPFSTPESQLQAAQTLDHFTSSGSGRIPQYPWTGDSGASGATTRTATRSQVALELQQSLSQEYAVRPAMSFTGLGKAPGSRNYTLPNTGTYSTYDSSGSVANSPAGAFGNRSGFSGPNDYDRRMLLLSSFAQGSSTTSDVATPRGGQGG